MSMSKKCPSNHNNNNPDNPLTSRRIDRGKNEWIEILKKRIHVCIPKASNSILIFGLPFSKFNYESYSIKRSRTCALLGRSLLPISIRIRPLNDGQKIRTRLT